MFTGPIAIHEFPGAIQLENQVEDNIFVPHAEGSEGNETGSGESDGDQSYAENSHGNSSDPGDSDPEDSSHDEDEDGSDDEADFPEDNTPLYNGAQITFGESLIAILSFVLSHKLTGQCLNDLLSLIALHCGPNNLCLTTLYKFKKYFRMIGKSMIICHFFCSVCEVPLETKTSLCATCNGQHDVNYFIEFPLATQLQNMYSRPGFFESLMFKQNRQKRHAANIEDIYDGIIYQRLVASGFLANPNNISFFMYFDGVAIFKHSAFSIWPVYLSINELKYTQRTKKENVLLAGLWFGKKKPNVNLFLQPIHASLSSLENNGVNLNLPNGQVVSVRAKVIGAVADMPAKSQFMRLTQYNGAYSCFLCTAQGGRFDLGNASVQVFPYSRRLDIRKDAETQEFAQQAVIARQVDPEASVYGLKGPSLLSVILPSMILCMGIDVMHGVFLGLMRTICSLWFDSQHSTSQFSISAFIHIVDIRLKRIKPPACFKVPRSLKKEFALMKASDFKMFFFFYSLPVLVDILPLRYWQHHCKVVTAIALLCQDSISPEQIDVAEELLHSYVSDFQQLYGIRHLTLTFHQLLHLPLIVRHLGNAWVYSCFFYESLNGEFARLVHGSRHAALQICTTSSVFMNHSVRVNSMNDSDVKVFCLRLMHRTKLKLKVAENIDQQSDVVGNMRACNPVPPNVRRLVQETFHVNGGRYKYFYRLKIRGTVYNSATYVRSTQKLSCFVLILSGGTPYLCKVNHFVRWSSCVNCPVGCNDCRKLYACIVSMYERIPWEVHDAPQNATPHYLDKVSPTNEIRAFPVDDIKSVCLYMLIDDDKEYLGVPVNSLEVE